MGSYRRCDFALWLKHAIIQGNAKIQFITADKLRITDGELLVSLRIQNDTDVFAMLDYCIDRDIDLHDIELHDIELMRIFCRCGHC
jgi:hypothetical protein